jgi:hypothetical protein
VAPRQGGRDETHFTDIKMTVFECAQSRRMREKGSGRCSALTVDPQ